MLPRCASEDCEAGITVVVLLDNRVPLAFACTLPHLREFMFATRALGDRRLITKIGSGSAAAAFALDAEHPEVY